MRPPALPTPHAAGHQPIEPRRSALSPALSQNLTSAQEAAVLYADGRENDALALLTRILDAGGGADGRPQLWQMLFDLLRARGEWTRYEALGPRFEHEFGVAPPQWLNEHDMERLPEELRPGAAGYFQFFDSRDTTRDAEIAKVRAAARGLTTVHLDLSRIRRVDEVACTSFAKLLRFLPNNGNGVLLTGANHILELLREAVNSAPSVKAPWTLLLEMHRVLGQPSEFDRAALEYALAIGGTPPVWQPIVTPLPDKVAPQEKRENPRYQTGPEVMALTGVMWGSSDAQLRQVREFAQDRDYVNIQLAELKRIDFTCGSAFASLVNELKAGGQTVRLLRPNSLVAAFLGTLDLGQEISIAPPRKKSA